MRLFFLILGLSLASPVFAQPQKKAAQVSPEGRALQRIFDEAWEQRVAADPLFATSLGRREANDKLPDMSLKVFKARLAEQRALLERLKAIDAKELKSRERVNYRIFKRLLQDRVREARFKTYLMPITNRDGFHVSFPQLHKSVPLKTYEDYRNYCARLEAFGVYADQHIALMRQGIKSGHVLPRIVLEGYEKAIEPHIVADARESMLYKPFTEMPESFTARQRGAIELRGAAAIRGVIVPAYRRFLDFMGREYFPASRSSIGASALPAGRAFYEHRVKRFTTLNMSPEQVHARGLSEVARIRGEMHAVIKEAGFTGGFAAWLKFLREDPRFYAETPEQLMKEVAYVLKKMDGQLPKLFKTLPRMPYGIRKIPDFIAPRTTTAYYNRPSGDGTRAGFYYVNTYNLKSRPLYEVEALSLHEAVPGHHLQIARQQELKGLPRFRRYDGFTAFVEGWGLYAERLGLESGFYEDPYSNFGRLSYEMWRACRLVVDTGMHALGWTRQQAIDFMASNTALAEHNVVTEIDRYISWPGQALAYKTGELKIRELRSLAEKELRADFDVRLFHDVVLGSGSVPLDILEDNIRAYIKKTLRKRGRRPAPAGRPRLY